MFASHQLPVAIKIAEYIGSNVSKWHSETGACYLRIIESGTIKADWLSLEMCRRALAAYAEAKDKVAVEKVETLYASFKPTAHLVNIKIPFTPKANELAIKLAKSSKRDGMLLLKLPEDRIYHALSSGFLFPKLSTFPASVHKERDEYTKLFYSVRFDGQKNIITKNDEEKRHLYSLYSHHAQLILNPYLYEVFYEGIKKRILTLDGFLYYLKNNTWIGKADPTIDFGGEVSSIDWVKLLQPAITQFFVQVHMFGNSQYFNPDFVLCIDSLSLKFEGLLRAF